MRATVALNGSSHRRARPIARCCHTGTVVSHGRRCLWLGHHGYIETIGNTGLDRLRVRTTMTVRFDTIPRSSARSDSIAVRCVTNRASGVFGMTGGLVPGRSRKGKDGDEQNVRVNRRAIMWLATDQSIIQTHVGTHLEQNQAAR